MTIENKMIMFTDGACSGNPGPGGWAAVLILPNGVVQELGGGDPSTTNNRMEMTATLEALRHLSKVKGDVQIYTDSVYVIRGITQWVWGWKRNSWKTAEGKEVLNKDLWIELHDVVQGRKALGALEWSYVRGHTGVPGNERCDEIAVAFSKGERISLYKGSLDHYDIDIMRMPVPEPLPEMKGKSNGDKKNEKVSYLSNIGGIVYRHQDWPSCQRRVSGQSNAKFKKTKSSAEESEVLKSWGLSEATPIKEG